VWEISVGDKCKLMRPKAHRVADKCEREVEERCKLTEWDASPETEAKSYGPGMQPFERSKNPIQVNLFGEQAFERNPWRMQFLSGWNM